MKQLLHRAITYSVIAFLALCLPLNAQKRYVDMGGKHDPVLFNSIVNLGLMVIDIHTLNGEWPACDYVTGPPGAWGNGITNVTEVPGRLQLIDGNNTLYDSGEYVENVAGMMISLRGNSSAYYDKKPYKIKLNEKADLLCRNNANYRDKHWILINDLSLKAFQGLELSRLLEMTWVPAYRYVNVVINDVYCGVYMLVESVRRNTNCRLNVKKDGFIFESDAYWWNESFYIPSMLEWPLHFTFKYPDPNDLTSSQITYIKGVLKAYENSLFNGTYQDYIDVKSFASWMLGQDILSTGDAYGINRYYTKYDSKASSKIVMPMMWDFDSSESRSQQWALAHDMLMYPFFNSENRAFVKEYVRQWRRVAPILHPYMKNLFDKFKESAQGKAITASIPLDNKRWDKQNDTYSFYYFRAQWFKTRFQWLNDNIEALAKKGDVNLDGTVDVLDVNIIINMILNGDVTGDSDFADMNGDADVDVVDLNIAINIILTENPIDPEQSPGSMQ